MDLKSNASFKGEYIIRKWCSKTGKLLWESPLIQNKIVSGVGFGRNLVIRLLGRDNTYVLGIDSAKIGTGNLTPSDADSDLQTAVAATITFAGTSYPTNDSVRFDLFIADANLPNGTYKEFGLFSNLRLFARSLITPNYSKSSNQDTTISYTITLS